MKLKILLTNLLVLAVIVCAGRPRLAQASQWEQLGPPVDANGRYNLHAPLASWGGD